MFGGLEKRTVNVKKKREQKSLIIISEVERNINAEAHVIENLQG